MQDAPDWPGYIATPMAAKDPEDWAVFEATTEVPSSSSLAVRQGKAAGTPLRLKQAKAAQAKNTGDSISEKDVSPAAAFEVFAGRQYWSTPRDDLSDSVAVDRAREWAAAERRRLRNVETPLERYHRLKAEVSELAADVKVMCSDSTAAGNDSEAKDTANARTNDATFPSAPWGEMSAGLELLGQQLSEIARVPGLNSSVNLPGDLGRISEQSLLSQQLLANVAKLQAQAANKDSGASSTSVKYDSSADGTPQILLLDPSNRDAVAASRIAELEARCHRVEKALGDMSTFHQVVAASKIQSAAKKSANDSETAQAVLSDGGSKGLLGIISSLEKRVELLTPGRLDEVGKRVAVLSAELKNLMSLRKQQSKTTGGISLEEDEKINELYGLLERLQGLDRQLPILVERLETLQGLHHQTATFAKRLEALEGATENAKANLNSNETILAELETSVAANMERMADNMKLLDEKMSLQKNN